MGLRIQGWGRGREAWSSYGGQESGAGLVFRGRGPGRGQHVGGITRGRGLRGGTKHEGRGPVD